MIVQNKLYANCLLILPNGDEVKLDATGTAEVADDCGIFTDEGECRIGDGWLLLEGTPSFSVDEQGAVVFEPGPVVLWQGPAYLAGGLTTAPSGCEIKWDANAQGKAPQNCGLEGIDGFSVVGEAPEAEEEAPKRGGRRGKPVAEAQADEAKDAPVEASGDTDAVAAAVAAMNGG